MSKTSPDSELSLGEKSTTAEKSPARARAEAGETKKAEKPAKPAESEKPGESETEASPAPPRTVKRRAPRRVASSKKAAAKPAAAESVKATKSAKPAEPAKPAETAEAPETVQSAGEARTDAQAQPAKPATSVEKSGAGSAKSSDPAPRTGRIEVPVPSVQRARERGALAEKNPVVLRTESLTKSYGEVLAATDVSIVVHGGSFTGVVGPNGAGKTTVLSMISGLNRPTSGRITVHDIDVWVEGPKAKRLIGTLPDRLRLFDRLTGAQLLYYVGVLQGVEDSSVAMRAKELAQAFGLESALDRLVSDYSAGMQKKIGLACAMIHAPDVLVLDEPFEAIDPVSASNVTDILEKFVAGGGSVIMSSHSLDLIQRICDHVAVIVDGAVIAEGTVDSVRDGLSLEERFKDLTRVEDAGKGLEWLHGSSDSE